MFLMFSKIHNFLWDFPTKSKHLITLKIKDKKIILTNLYFRQFYIPRNLELQGSLWVNDPYPDPGDPKRPDPTGS